MHHKEKVSRSAEDSSMSLPEIARNRRNRDNKIAETTQPRPTEHIEVTRRGKSYVLSADAEAQTGDKSAKCGEVVRSTRSDTKYSSDEQRDVERWFAANYVCEDPPGSCFQQNIPQ